VVAFLAAMLVVQAMLFVWAVSETGRTLPGQSPGRLGMTVAVDLANVLERDPQVDLAKYVNDQYKQYNHPFFVMMKDGRFLTSGSTSFPEPLLRMARARLERAFDRGPGIRGDRTEGPRPPDRGRGLRPPPPDWWEMPDRFADRFERDPSGYRFIRPSPIIVHGQLAGIVVVPPQAPFGYLLGRFAPILAVVAIGVLIVGTVLTSLMIFGPARRRLRALEVAARRLGAGDLAARAPDRGGDEIAAVARAFNAMAHDLAARAYALSASDRARRQLLADVSDELNTPVTAMRGYLEKRAGNAIRQTPPGSTIHIDACRNGHSVRLSVADEGPGIAAEHLPYIFDRFYKADAARAGVSGGSGLGLSIVKAIVERHGASITVRSQPGHTMFEIAGLRTA